jgi:hypothetical protein
MALVQCTECSQPVSTDSRVCPHCGKPKPFKTERSTRFLVFILIAFAVVALRQTFDILGSFFSGNEAVRISPSQPKIDIAPTASIIDLPAIAFQPRLAVERLLGKPLKLVRDTNMTTWKEGAILQAHYKRADLTYLEQRLVAITFRFDPKARPKSVSAALDSCGLPGMEARAPYRAMQLDGTAIRCCGFAIWLVTIPEGFSEIDVVFANINYRFVEWPSETQTAWLEAGGQEPFNGRSLKRPFLRK